MAGDPEHEVEAVDHEEGASALAVAVAGAPPVLTVTGEVTIETSGALASEVAKLVRGSKPEELVFELAGVTFMDSSGLTVLVHAAARCHHVVVRNPSVAVRRVIEATGLTQLLRLEP